MSGRWLGRCPGCGAFGTMVEEAPPSRGAVERPGRCCGSSTSRPRRPTGSRPASPSSTACSAAASCRPRSCSSAASPGSGSRRCSSPRSGRSRAARRALLVTGEESVVQVKLRAARLGGCDGGRDPRRDRARRGLRGARARASGSLRDRLGADALLVRDRLRARLGLAGARGGGADPPRREGGGRRHVPRRPRDEGRLGRRGRACSSTSSTACSSSRATATTPTASSGRRRTASARRTSSRCSR